MEALVVAAWERLGPRFECAVGDVDWRMFRSTTVQPFDNIRLWEDGRGTLVGYAWLITNGDLDIVVYPRDWCAVIVPEMLSWAERRAGNPGAIGRAAVVPVAWSLASNAPLTDAIVSCGLSRTGKEYEHLWRPLGLEMPHFPLPAGYAVRAVAGADEAAARAALHRAAFPHSNIDADVYRRLMASRHYRADLDIVVVAPGGELAAAALAWFDARNRTGEFEPAAAHCAHRRRGLVSIALAEGLRRLRGLGAEAAIVYAEGGNAASGALYRRLGFTVTDTQLGFARPR
jgi:ribosomal protein S18 acetylase RimI-like enzyme